MARWSVRWDSGDGDGGGPSWLTVVRLVVVALVALVVLTAVVALVAAAVVRHSP